MGQIKNIKLHIVTDIKNAENMMRRLSSFKSAPKSLVENISFDQEFYGYENGGCSVFAEDDEHNEIDTVDDDVVRYATPTTLTTSTGATTLNTVVASDSELNESDEGESGSDTCDSDCDSPTQQKKGLKRFFCMPVKSMKAMKSLRLPTKKAPKQS